MLKFLFCFVETTHESLHLRQMNFGIVKDHGHTNKFYLNHNFVFFAVFKYDDGAKF
jgi:hypothetical protein